MSKSLSSKICSLVLSSLFAVSAVSPNSLAHGNTLQNNATSKSFGTRLKEGCKDFYKKHPKLCKAGIVAASIAGVKVMFKLGRLAYREWCLRDVVTKIDSYSKEQVDFELENEIKKYKDRAPDIFKVDDRLLKLDKRFLLLTFMKLNYLFDKYHLFTKEFINCKKSCKDSNKTFLIRPLNIRDDGIVAIRALEATNLDLSGFLIRDDSLKERLYETKGNVNSGFYSACKMDELVEYTITHEFGHLIETFYITQKCGLTPNNINKGGAITTNKVARTLKKETFQILDDIDNIIGNNLSNSTPVTSSISRYGDTDPGEFFAETFAHLECSDPKNVNELGKALDKFIVDTMHYRAPILNENI